MILELFALMFFGLVATACAHSLAEMAKHLRGINNRSFCPTRGIELELERIRKEIEKQGRKETGVCI